MNLKKIIIDIQQNTRKCYIIYGTEEILIEKFKRTILEELKKKIKYCKNINIKKKKNWNSFFYECKKKDFFYKKKILNVEININNIEKKYFEKMKKYKKFFSLNIIIITLNKANYKKFLDIKFQNFFSKNKILISCFNFKKQNYLNWIKNYFINNQISRQGKKYLYKKFKNNILSLNNNLDILSLTFPNEKITTKKIKKIIKKDYIKNIFEWINYLLLGKSKKSLYALYNLHKKNISPLSLIRYLETQIKILILLKKEKKNTKEIFLNKNKIWKQNHYNYIRSSKKNNYKNFLKIIKILIWIELSIKKIEKEFIWISLQEISIMFH